MVHVGPAEASVLIISTDDGAQGSSEDEEDSSLLYCYALEGSAMQHEAGMLKALVLAARGALASICGEKAHMIHLFQQQGGWITLSAAHLQAVMIVIVLPGQLQEPLACQVVTTLSQVALMLCGPSQFWVNATGGVGKRAAKLQLTQRAKVVLDTVCAALLRQLQSVHVQAPPWLIMPGLLAQMVLPPHTQHQVHQLLAAHQCDRGAGVEFYKRSCCLFYRGLLLVSTMPAAHDMACWQLCCCLGALNDAHSTSTSVHEQHHSIAGDHDVGQAAVAPMVWVQLVDLSATSCNTERLPTPSTSIATSILTASGMQQQTLHTLAGRMSTGDCPATSRVLVVAAVGALVAVVCLRPFEQAMDLLQAGRLEGVAAVQLLQHLHKQLGQELSHTLQASALLASLALPPAIHAANSYPPCQPSSLSPHPHQAGTDEQDDVILEPASGRSSRRRGGTFAQLLLGRTKSVQAQPHHRHHPQPHSVPSSPALLHGHSHPQRHARSPLSKHGRTKAPASMPCPTSPTSHAQQSSPVRAHAFRVAGAQHRSPFQRDHYRQPSASHYHHSGSGSQSGVGAAHAHCQGRGGIDAGWDVNEAQHQGGGGGDAGKVVHQGGGASEAHHWAPARIRKLTIRVPNDGDDSQPSRHVGDLSSSGTGRACLHAQHHAPLSASAAVERACHTASPSRAALKRPQGSSHSGLGSGLWLRQPFSSQSAGIPMAGHEGHKGNYGTSAINGSSSGLVGRVVVVVDLVRGVLLPCLEDLPAGHASMTALLPAAWPVMAAVMRQLTAASNAHTGPPAKHSRLVMSPAQLDLLAALRAPPDAGSRLGVADNQAWQLHPELAPWTAVQQVVMQLPHPFTHWQAIGWQDDAAKCLLLLLQSSGFEQPQQSQCVVTEQAVAILERCRLSVC